MKSHEDLYLDEITALRNAGIADQSPEEVKEYLRKFDWKEKSPHEISDEVLKTFLMNCPVADDGKWIFPTPVDGKYPVDLVAVLFLASPEGSVFSRKEKVKYLPSVPPRRPLDDRLLAIDIAQLEFDSRWEKLSVDISDPVAAFQSLLDNYLQIQITIFGKHPDWPEINVRAILSGECRDLESAHRLMTALSDTEVSKKNEKLTDEIREMFKKCFDAQAEQEYIDREFAAAVKEIDSAVAEFPADAPLDQVLESSECVEELLWGGWGRKFPSNDSVILRTFPWLNEKHAINYGIYSIWGNEEINPRFQAFNEYYRQGRTVFEIVSEILQAKKITDLDGGLTFLFENDRYYLPDIPNCRWIRDVRSWLEKFRLETIDRLKPMIKQEMDSFSTPVAKTMFLEFMLNQFALPSDLEKYVKELYEQNHEKGVSFFGENYDDGYRQYRESIGDPWIPIYDLHEMDKNFGNYIENKKLAAEAKIRRKVLFEMSHSIKNLIASVTDPLDQLYCKLEDDGDRFDIENALTGAKLIRELALQVHMSMRGEQGAWRKDWNHNSGTRLDSILEKALLYAVNNMFSGKYFGRFARAYFGDSLESYTKAKTAVEGARGLDPLAAVLKEHFFDCRIDFPEKLRAIPVADAEGTATKFLILFQEILLNAVKYTAFAEPEKRFVKIRLEDRKDGFSLAVSNSAKPNLDPNGHDTAENPNGIGHIVIRNFAELFQAEHHAGFAEDGTYEVKLDFSF